MKISGTYLAHLSSIPPPPNRSPKDQLCQHKMPIGKLDLLDCCCCCCFFESISETISLSHLVLDEVVADTVLFKDLPTISIKPSGEWLRVE